VDISTAGGVGGVQPGWLNGKPDSSPRRGPSTGVIFLSADAACNVTNGTVYYFCDPGNTGTGGAWFSIGLINRGAGTATLAASPAPGYMEELRLPAGATRLAFSATLSAGNVTVRFTEVHVEA
jgi:hypothetical protein